MIQGVDIRNHTVEQFPLTKTRQPGRGEGQQFTEGVNAQMLQHAECRVMADQSLEVPSSRTGNGGAADARRRKHVVEAVEPGDPRHGRGRQEPAGKREQADAGKQGHNGQHDAQRQHPFMAFIEREIGKQGTHQMSS